MACFEYPIGDGWFPCSKAAAKEVPMWFLVYWKHRAVSVVFRSYRHQLLLLQAVETIRLVRHTMGVEFIHSTILIYLVAFGIVNTQNRLFMEVNWASQS